MNITAHAHIVIRYYKWIDHVHGADILGTWRQPNLA